MSKLNLTIATGNYDRTRPISDGRVNIEASTRITILSPRKCFIERFDSSHSTCASFPLPYCVGACNPDFLTAVPVFLSRAFRHAAIFTRNDADIDKPSDLKGKIFGVMSINSLQMFG